MSEKVGFSKSAFRLALVGLAVGVAIILAIGLFRDSRESLREPPGQPSAARPPDTLRSEPSAETRSERPDASPLAVPKPMGVERRLSEIVNRLATAVKVKNVWKEEIKLLIALEDLLLDPVHGSRVKELLVGKISDSSTGRDLSGLLTFALTVSPTDAGRKEMAALLGKNKDNDASLVHAVTLRNSRAGPDSRGREAFWKGCMNFMERSELLDLGFRARLYKEEYGRTLEQVAQAEPVRPSGADAFDSQITSAFHSLQKKGFTTFIEETDSVRESLIGYLTTGDSPEAKRAICRLLKPGGDLAHAAREAFMNSQSYSHYARRALLNAVQEGSAGRKWETLYSLYPYAGDMKYEMLERMASSAKAGGPTQDLTLKLLQGELVQGSIPEHMLDRLLDRVSEFQSDASEKYLLALCRNHAAESVRSTAVSALYSDGLAGSANAALIQSRVTCVVEGFLRDPSTHVSKTAANVLSLFISEEGHTFRIPNATDVRQRVEVLLAQEVINREVADTILKGLERYSQ